MATGALVKIPGVTSSQIINNTSIPLKSGALTLTEPLASIETEAKLFLNIKPDNEEEQPLTFPLYTEACLGSKEGRIWRFEMAEKDLGLLEVEFPEDVDEESALQFEKIFVYYGFLKTGLVGDADNFSRSIRETASSLSSKIVTKTDNRNEATPATETDTEFSDITKDVVDGAQRGTSKAAQVTGDIGKVVSGAVFDAGAWIGRNTGLKSAAKPTEPTPPEDKSLARETMDQTLEAGEAAAKALGSGIMQVGTTMGESASKIAEHDHGSQAKELVDTTRQTGANVGAVGVDMYTGTSVVWHGGIATVGATKAAEADEEVDGDDMTEEEKKVEEKKIKLVNNTDETAKKDVKEKEVEKEEKQKDETTEDKSSEKEGKKKDEETKDK